MRGFISFCVCWSWSDCWLLDDTAGADIKEMQNKQCMSLDLSLWSVYRLLTRCEITPRPRCV